ncbi:MAG: hypothetical protein VYA51_00140 [Planctomycetota bacterium]|nr:hypothetical protein [Planctomycetota bacterium]
MAASRRNEDESTAFLEAISQWQLAARTELKRASSLPSSMFDASDPMVEARLAEAVDAMMRRLERPQSAPAPANPSGDHLERGTEQVSLEALRALPREIRVDLDAADLDDRISAEYLNVLIDACTTGDAPVRRAARELLSKDFDVAVDRDLRAATDSLADCLTRHASAGAADTRGGRSLEALCAAIAATVVDRADADEEAPQ